MTNAVETNRISGLPLKLVRHLLLPIVLKARDGTPRWHWLDWNQQIVCRLAKKREVERSHNAARNVAPALVSRCFDTAIMLGAYIFDCAKHGAIFDRATVE
jgi:hypothetical protein